MTANRTGIERIAELEAAAAKPPVPDETVGDVVISEAANRVMIRFAGKPDEATRTALVRTMIEEWIARER